MTEIHRYEYGIFNVRGPHSSKDEEHDWLFTQPFSRFEDLEMALLRLKDASAARTAMLKRRNREYLEYGVRELEIRRRKVVVSDWEVMPNNGPGS